MTVNLCSVLWSENSSLNLEICDWDLKPQGRRWWSSRTWRYSRFSSTLQPKVWTHRKDNILEERYCDGLEIILIPKKWTVNSFRHSIPQERRRLEIYICSGRLDLDEVYKKSTFWGTEAMNLLKSMFPLDKRQKAEGTTLLEVTEVYEVSHELRHALLTLRSVLRAEWSDGLVLILRVPPRLV